MKTTEHRTLKANASLHPHSGEGGPFNLTIGSLSQPPIVQNWKEQRVRAYIQQPDEDNNFTMIQVLFSRKGQKIPWILSGLQLKSCPFYKYKAGVVRVRFRARLINSFPAPVPIGRYTGTCTVDEEGKWAVYTFQAMTLRREPKPSEPKTIITPGDPEYDQSLSDIKRAFPGANGLG